MLIHIRPTLYGPREVAIVDVEIAPLGIKLVGGVDITIGRPYPNKWYKVARRKQGNKAVKGILLETAEPIDKLVCISRWAVAAEFCVTHRVEYQILDRDFDAASDSTILWHACCEELGGWSDRMPKGGNHIPPMARAPRMDVFPDTRHELQSSKDTIERGVIVYRFDRFAMPTIERQRILDPKRDDRMPTLDMTFLGKTHLIY
jgi:hypothetical protein